MTHKECAEILRSIMQKRERMHCKEIVVTENDGTEAVYGYMTKEDDLLYQALEMALTCIEEKIHK